MQNLLHSNRASKNQYASLAGWILKLGGGLLLLFLSLDPVSAAQPSVLPVIPAVQQWSSASGEFQLAGQSRVLISDAALIATAQTLAQDLFDLTGKIFPVVVGTDPRPGDILLEIGSTTFTQSTEAYSLAVGAAVRITGSTDSGVFDGTRTLLQLLRQGSSVPAGTAHDWPLYPERGFMLDVGNKFFSVDFLRRQIREQAYLKMNYFHLHLTQDEGFRLESTSHPEVVSPEHYTKAEIAELIQLATQYHVALVPEIDVPSHATAMLRNHPELQLPNHPDMLDLSQPGAYTLVQDLLQEFLPLFPAAYWHTGGDEYLLDMDYALYPQYTAFARQLYGPTANGQDLYVGFINQIDEIVKQHGKRLRAWNDLHGVTTVVNKPNKDIILELYSANIGAANALNQGFAIVNCSPVPLYYVLGVPSLRADPANLYENWLPNLQFVLGETVPPLSPGLLGGKMHVWADFPNAESPDQVQEGIFSSLRSFSQKSWGSPDPFPTYNEFSGFINSLGRVPGWTPDFGIIADSMVSLPPGESRTIEAVVKANSSFTGALSAMCSSNDPAISCSLSVGHFSLGPTGEQRVLITIDRPAASGSSNVSLGLFLCGGPFIATLLVLSRERQPFGKAIVLLAILVPLGCSTGCGHRPPSVTVTMAAAALSHSVTIDINKGR
jgi:hexosaminidase